MQRLKPFPTILKYIQRNACYKKTLIHKYNHNLAFKLILPKVYNQNNLSNKKNSFIPQISSDLATPATSNLDLKSSIHSTHNNSKTLKLFSKSSVVNLSIDGILT